MEKAARTAGKMRPEIKSRIHVSVHRIAKRAREMPDQVERLRYLRSAIVIDPCGNRRGIQLWPPGRAAMVVTAIAGLAGVAVLIWRAF
jgi:hypothetical protein